MNNKIRNYIFNASARTITFPGFVSMNLSDFAIITNSIADVIIYNFAVPAKGGTVSGNVLTLTFDTSAMANSDPLQILYDDPTQNPATRENQINIEDLLTAQLITLQEIKALTNALNGVNLNAVLAAGSATIGSINAITTLPTLANVTTVATLTNLAQIGSVSAAEFLFNQSQLAAAQANSANIFYT